MAISATMNKRKGFEKGVFMDILGKMKQPHFFSNSEQAVIDYISKQPDILKKATVKELANTTYTSASTIVRLYQKLDCQNYSDFKLQFLSAVENRKGTLTSIDANFPFHKGDSFSDLSKNIGILSCDAINETLSLIDETIYQKAIDILHNADHIDLYGVGTNQSLAFDFKMNLMRIGKNVNVSHDHQQLTISAAYSTPGHVALIMSYTGETHETIEYCRLLKKSKTPMICITNIGNNTISDLCDISLKIVSKERMFSKIGMFSSKMSIMLILDILYSGIFVKNYDDNITLLFNKRKITTNFRSNVPPLLED